MYANTGRILKVDLSEGAITKLTVDEEAERKYIGGRALAKPAYF